MKDTPDLLIHHDTKIVQQLMQMLMGKKNDGVSISIVSINQINFQMDSKRLNSPEQKLIMRGRPPAHNYLAETVPPLTKQSLTEALEACGWSKNKAADKLHKSRSTIFQAVRKFGILPPSGYWPSRRGLSPAGQKQLMGK